MAMNTVGPVAMEAQSTTPILHHGRLRKNRKYGRYDFERFDHLAPAHASIGSGTFDKVYVDCKFLFKKSRWGVLGEHKNPAGIIYLDLTFHQPKDSRLHSATVIVTLDEEDEDLRRMRNKRERPLFGPECPVQITDCYGPKGFTGPEKTIQTKNSLHLTPNAQFAGYGIGGMGLDKESEFTQSSRWNFSGHLLPGKGKHWTYKTLKWDLSENDLETQSTHSNEVHTAFAFEHGGQPFFIRVEIKGKLKKLHGRVKDKLMKFPSGSNKENDSVVTLINFNEQVYFRPLDEWARGLEFEMEMANLNAIPMEVSDPKPATFSNMPQTAEVFNTSRISAFSGSWDHGATSGNSGLSNLSAPTQPHLIQGMRGLSQSEDPTEPTLENLAHVFVKLQTLDQQASHNDKHQNLDHQSYHGDLQNANRHEDCENTKPSSNTSSASGSTTLGANSETWSEKGLQVQKHISEEQMVAQLLRMPAFLMMMRLVMGLLGLFGQKMIDNTAAEKEEETQLAQVRDKVGDEAENFGRRGVDPVRHERAFERNTFQRNKHDGGTKFSG